MTCEQCSNGVQKRLDWLLLGRTMKKIVDYLSGENLCAKAKDAKECIKNVKTLIPLALPVLTANPYFFDEYDGLMVCNSAFPDICY